MKHDDDMTMIDYYQEKEYWKTGKYKKPKKRISNLSIVKSINTKTA